MLLATGDLRGDFRLKGRFAGAIKALQANLRHITWQVQAIANGDLTQRVDFMGDFSAAFNKMVEGIIESRQQLVIMATTDVLTGLCNRRNFYLESEKLAKLSMRGARPLCLLMLDIDFFKKINDTYGHDAGDEILRQFAVVGQSAVRSTDIFARFGGEEFVLLLPDTDVATAEVVAERLRAQIEASCTNYEDKCIRLTCSIGLADNGSEYSIDEMLKRADGGLYTAKQQGRNQVVRVLL